MFIVFNKQKIYSYLVALGTIVILFVIAFAATNHSDDIIQTSSNIEIQNSQTNSIENNQYLNDESINQIIDNSQNNQRNELRK